jgi:hypothetical protein
MDTYEIAELVPGTRFVMRTADGPFPMVTTYEFSVLGAEATRMTLRIHGIPAGFAKIAARGTERAMRSANEKDVQRLMAVPEASPRAAYHRRRPQTLCGVWMEPAIADEALELAATNPLITSVLVYEPRPHVGTSRSTSASHLRACVGRASRLDAEAVDAPDQRPAHR